MGISLNQATCAIRLPIFWQQRFLFHICVNFHASLSSLLIFGASFYQVSCDYVLFFPATTASVHTRIHPALQALQMLTSLILPCCACPSPVWGPSILLFHHFGSVLSFWEYWNNPSSLSRCMGMQVDLRLCRSWLSNLNLQHSIFCWFNHTTLEHH